jgi:hypothetical protein
VCAFVDYCLLHSGQTIEDDSAGTSLDIVNGLLDGEEAYCGRYSEAVESLKSAFGCHDGYVKMLVARVPYGRSSCVCVIKCLEREAKMKIKKLVP